MSELREEFSWVKEVFEKGEIRIELEHQTYAKQVFEERDQNTKIDYFIELFMGSLFLSQQVELTQLKGVGHVCQECGQTIIYEYDLKTNELRDYIRNRETNTLKRGSCLFVNDYTFEIAVPTGELIGQDQLPYSSEMLSPLEETEHSLNSRLGVKERTLAYANQNIFHVFVGNTCPAVFKKGNLLVVGHTNNNEDGPCSCGLEGCECDYEEYPPIDDAIKIAEIWTDLWWVSLVDVAIYEQLLIDYYGSEQAQAYMRGIKPIETKIRPGVYQCTYLRCNENEERPSIYATLEWIRELE